jgi:hypothetical protein
MLTYTRTIEALRASGLEYTRTGKWTLTVAKQGKRRKVALEPCKVLYLKNVKPCAFYSFEAIEAALAL